MLKLEERFKSLTGKDLLKFIKERFDKYKFFESHPHVKIIIPILSVTGRWAASKCGLLVIIEGSEDCYELNVIRHSFLGLFGAFIEVEFAVRDLYKVISKSDVEIVEYEFSIEGFTEVK